MSTIWFSLKKLAQAGILACLVGGAFLMIPNLTVHASAAPQGENPPAARTPAPGETADLQGLRPPRLERIYRRELRVLAAQANRLERVGSLTDRAEELIERLKERGINTQALETALTDFKAALPAAVSANARAKSTLDAHAGFDANGKVTDAAAARETVKSAGKDLREAHKTIQDAFRDLQRTLRTFRHDNRNPQPQPSPGAPGVTPAP